MSRFITISVVLISMLIISCSNPDDLNTTAESNEVVSHKFGGLIITGGPFSFNVGNGGADYVNNIHIIKTSPVLPSYLYKRYLICDSTGKILKIVSSKTSLYSTNFDVLPTGANSIFYIEYTNGVQGLSVSKKIQNLRGSYALTSNNVKAYCN